MPQFGTRSLKRLNTAHNVLQELCRRVVEHKDITILVGHRPEDEQNAAYNSGASTKKYPESKHNLIPSMAIDVAPWPIPEGWGDLKGKTIQAINLDWKERVKFYEMTAVFRFAWAQLCDDFPEIGQQYRIRFGADWDSDGDYRDQTFDDLPHIELIEVKVMARGLNKMQIIGHLGRDPDLRYTPSGAPVCKLLIATTDSYKDKQSGERIEETEWHNVILWNRQAEIAAEYLRKGRQVYIEGKKRTRKWQDKEGQDRYTVEIIAKDMQILGGKGKDTPDNGPTYHSEETPGDRSE